MREEARRSSLVVAPARRRSWVGPRSSDGAAELGAIASDDGDDDGDGDGDDEAAGDGERGEAVRARAAAASAPSAVSDDERASRETESELEETEEEAREEEAPLAAFARLAAHAGARRGENHTWDNHPTLGARGKRVLVGQGAGDSGVDGYDGDAPVLRTILATREQLVTAVDIGVEAQRAVAGETTRASPPTTRATPLHLCIANFPVTGVADCLTKSSPITTARLLLNYGAPWDAPGEDGLTPLHVAVFR